MGWYERLNVWCEDHWLLTAAFMGVFVGSFFASLSSFDWVDGLIAGTIWFAGYAVFGWTRFR